MEPKLHCSDRRLARNPAMLHRPRQCLDASIIRSRYQFLRLSSIAVRRLCPKTRSPPTRQSQYTDEIRGSGCVATAVAQAMRSQDRRGWLFRFIGVGAPDPLVPESSQSPDVPIPAKPPLVGYDTSPRNRIIRCVFAQPALCVTMINVVPLPVETEQ